MKKEIKETNKVPVTEMKPEYRKMKWYWWVVIIVISMMLGAAFKGDKVVTKEVVKEIPGQTITKEVPADLTNWKALKNKDDEIIQSASQAMFVMSDAITAISNYDIDTMNQKITEMENLTETITRLGNERKDILTKLGY